MAAAFEYPTIRRGDVVDNHHGDEVPDPYRHLEDPESEETQKFVAEQNKLSEGYIGQYELRDRIKERLTETYDYPKFGCPFKRGSTYYSYRNSGLQNQYVLYAQESLEAEPEVFLDPNLLSDDGTAALRSKAFSESGSHLAYGVSLAGSDWQTIHVRKADDKTDTEDSVEWVKFSGISWTHDDSGFFYSRYPTPSSLNDGDLASGKAGTEVDALKNHRVYFHKLGTSQSEDRLIFATPENPEWLVNAEVTDDGAFVLFTVDEGCEPHNKLYIAPTAQVLPADDTEAREQGSAVLAATAGGAPTEEVVAAQALLNTTHGLTEVLGEFVCKTSYVLNNGEEFYFLTNHEAPNYKVVAVDLSAPSIENWRDVVAEDPKRPLQYVVAVNEDRLILNYMEDCKDVLEIADLNGQKVSDVELPSVGSVQGISGRRKDTEFFFKFVSFLYPGTLFRYDFSAVDGAELSVFAQVTVKGFDPDRFTVAQEFYTSKDGTRVPMFIMSPKGVPKDGTGAALLYGYGGFQIPLTPYFSSIRTVQVQHFNMTYVIANIRGGSEYGEAWYKGGCKETKQNCFDDFCAAAEYLIAEGYCSSKTLAIHGGSNGGLLVAACANQRPELFGAAVAAVGVLDIYRFHLFSIGAAWTSDFGCVDNADDYAYQKTWSPLHNIPDEPPYPATLITSGTHDDRVVPLHSFKFIAELQHKLGSKVDVPLLARIETKAGHGGGKPTAMVIDEYADVFSFLARALSLEWTE